MPTLGVSEGRHERPRRSPHAEDELTRRAGMPFWLEETGF